MVNGPVPEPAEDLGVPSCISGGAERSGETFAGHHCIAPQFFRPSFVGFSIFDLPPNRISCFPE